MTVRADTPTYFKGVESFIRIHLAVGCTETIRRQLLDLWQDVAFEANVLTATILIDVVLELCVAELVSWLELAVVFSFLLNGVIG